MYVNIPVDVYVHLHANADIMYMYCRCRCKENWIAMVKNINVHNVDSLAGYDFSKCTFVGHGI